MKHKKIHRITFAFSSLAIFIYLINIFKTDNILAGVLITEPFSTPEKMQIQYFKNHDFNFVLEIFNDLKPKCFP